MAARCVASGVGPHPSEVASCLKSSMPAGERFLNKFVHSFHHLLQTSFSIVYVALYCATTSYTVNSLRERAST